MLEDAEKFKLTDKIVKERAELIVEAEGLIYATNRALSEFGESLAVDEKTTIIQDIDVMKKCIDEGGSTGDLRKAISNLEAAAHHIAEQIYGTRDGADTDDDDGEDIVDVPSPVEPDKEEEEPSPFDDLDAALSGKKDDEEAQED